MMLGLGTGCKTLPKAPQTSFCQFNNKHKPAHFRCTNSKRTKYSILATSKSADKMIAFPYQDWIELNAYWKKIFYLIEREYLGSK